MPADHNIYTVYNARTKFWWHFMWNQRRIKSLGVYIYDDIDGRRTVYDL